MVDLRIQVRVTYSNTRDAVALPHRGRELASLHLHVTVCAVVCVRTTTCVPHAGRSDELWRFSTSTRSWERVDSTVTNGDSPRGRDGHVMTSVGLDLWVHGGIDCNGEGDTCLTHVTLLLLPH